MSNITIPVNILIQCPITNFNQIYAQRCASCPNCKGIVDVYENSDFEQDKKDALTWSQRYQVICGQPMMRRVTEIEMH